MDSFSLLHKLQLPELLGLDPVSAVWLRKTVLDAAASVNAVPLAAPACFEESGKSPSSASSSADTTEPLPDFLEGELARLSEFRGAKEVRPTLVSAANYHQFIAVLRLLLIEELLGVGDSDTVLPGRPKMIKSGYGQKSFRGSRFRGVSKNKQKWQVLISIGAHKQYTGGILSEEQAARTYDRKSICTFGLRAKTNFAYTKAEVLSILQEEEPATI